jgi:hypothetical protein
MLSNIQADKRPCPLLLKKQVFTASITYHKSAKRFKEKTQKGRIRT